MPEKSPISIRHSFKLGDTITILPGLQHIYKMTGQKIIFLQRLNLPFSIMDENGHHSNLNEDGGNCMDRTSWEKLVPLLMEQEYIERCEVWEGQSFGIDFDLTRDRQYIPVPKGDIYYWPIFIYPQLATDLSEDWVKCWPVNMANTTGGEFPVHQKIIINRTERYTNPYFAYYFLKNHQDKLIFAGTTKEHKLFCEQWKLDIPYLIVKDFLELARVIRSCKFMIGNQSFCFHIAQAMHTPRLLEFCWAFPNTFPAGKNGYAYIYQDAFEYYFNKLLNEG